MAKNREEGLEHYETGAEMLRRILPREKLLQYVQSLEDPDLVTT